jgi:hypothetical protein
MSPHQPCGGRRQWITPRLQRRARLILAPRKTRANGYAFPKSARNFLSIGRHPDA